MRVVKQLGLALVAVIAFSALAVANASAALPLFLAHPTGPLSAKALTTQVFTTSIGSVECNKLKLLNTSALQLKSETQHATVDYDECTAFGIANAVISPALYRFHADGSVDLLGHVTITAPLCTALVFPTNGLKDVLFRNLHGAISINAHVNGIDSEGKGLGCPYGREQKGTYFGTSDVWLTNGGNLLWDS